MGILLVIPGCGSDSPSGTQQSKDAALGGKDASAPGSDVPATSDSKDLPPSSPDVSTGAESKDGPLLPGDVVGPQVDLPPDLAPADSWDVAAKDATDALEAIDTAMDMTMDTTVDSVVDRGGFLDATDERPSLDGPTVDVSALSAVIGFPCRSDSDCCIEIDSCMNVAYLYSKGPGAAPAPEIPASTGMCTGCIPPTIQVSCMSGQCVGTRVSGYPGGLMNSHCGFVPLDAGTHAPPNLDAGAPTTKSVWTCSG